MDAPKPRSFADTSSKRSFFERALARLFGGTEMMNPFERHGIEHLSPSTIATFTAAPAMFVLSKLLKRSQPVGAAAHRGTAVEAGVAHGLLNGADTSDCIIEALREFDTRAALSGDPKREKEREAIPGFVEQALNELRPYGAPSSVQGKVSLDVEGLCVPIIGFYDFEFDKAGIIVDLKTAHQCPSAIKRGHAKQVALYTACHGNFEGRISYVTPKKAATYRLENPREHLAALARGALTMQRFLSLSSDPMELAGLVLPDLDTFYWSNPSARQAAFEVWGV